jgi:hypothetical protein
MNRSKKDGTMQDRVEYRDPVVFLSALQTRRMDRRARGDREMDKKAKNYVRLEVPNSSATYVTDAGKAAVIWSV